jgi:hypothetical protein
VNILVVGIEPVKAHEIFHLILNDVALVGNFKKLSYVWHVVNVVFDVVANRQQRLMLDAAVLLHTEKMEVSNKPCPRRLLERLRWFDAFTADVNEDILKRTDIVKINSIDDRWGVEHKFTPKLHCCIGDFKFIVLGD